MAAEAQHLIALAVFLLVAVAGWRLAASSGKERGASSASSQPAQRLARWEASIDGLDCLLCAPGLQSPLRQLPGVTGAEVSFQDQVAAVDYDPLRTDVAHLHRAIQDSGFKVAAVNPPSGLSQTGAQSASQH